MTLTTARFSLLEAIVSNLSSSHIRSYILELISGFPFRLFVYLSFKVNRIHITCLTSARDRATFVAISFSKRTASKRPLKSPDVHIPLTTTLRRLKSSLPSNTTTDNQLHLAANTDKSIRRVKRLELQVS